MRIGWKPKARDPAIASVRFRYLTPMRALQAQGFPVEPFEAKAVDAYDAVIFSKLYGAEDQALAERLRRNNRRAILDLSDNHFYNPNGLAEYETAARDLKAMAERVDGVVCCSAALAEVVTQHASLQAPPLVVGDAVESFALPQRKAPPLTGDPFRILWFGSHGSPNAPAGMADVLRIRDHLETAAKRRKIELVVVSNNRAKFDEIRKQIAAPMRYVTWSADSFAKELAHADLVVIPVTPNPFTACKSNNRLATALRYGVPALADSIPAYEELAPFAILDDWAKGFDMALSASADLIECTEAGGGYVRERFNDARIAEAWRSAIETVIARPTA